MSDLDDARKKMWDAWATYTEARRDYERLERAAGEDFDIRLRALDKLRHSGHLSLTK